MTARIHQGSHLALQLSVLWHFWFFDYWFNLFTNYWSVMEILLRNPGCCWRAVGPSNCSPRAGQTCTRPFHFAPPLLGRSALPLQPVSPQISGSRASSGDSPSQFQIRRWRNLRCPGVLCRGTSVRLCMSDSLQVKGREKEALVPSWCWRLHYRVILQALHFGDSRKGKWGKSQNGWRMDLESIWSRKRSFNINGLVMSILL